MVDSDGDGKGDACDILRGDGKGDGTVDLLDILTAVNHIVGPRTLRGTPSWPPIALVMERQTFRISSVLST